MSSLVLHLLPLLALVSWLRPPLDTPAPIPIQLVIEQPPPAPEPTPAPAEPKPHTPPPGRLASDDFGDVGPAKGPKKTDAEQPPQKPLSSGTEAPVAAEAEPPATAEQPSPPAKPTQTATLVAPPPPEPPPELSLPTPAALPLPAPPAPPKPLVPKRRPVERPPMLTGLTLPLPLYADSANAASASARFPGPNASRDDYCAYALFLVMKHVNLLPESLVGARRGETTLTIRLRDDGAVISTMVARGSGYSDIDERVVQMVNAVGKFPKLPMWVPGPTADFTFRLHFPHTPPS